MRIPGPIIWLMLALALLLGSGACSTAPANAPATAASTTVLPTAPAAPTPPPSPTPPRSSTPPRPTPTLNIPATILPTLPAAPAVPGSPEPPQGLTQYALYATLNTRSQQLVVTQTITLTNPSPQVLDSLPLVVAASRYANVFTLNRLTDGEGSVLPHRWQDTLLTINLPAPLEPGQRLVLHLDYSLALPETARLPQVRPHPLGYSATQTNLGDWYPFVPPYTAGSGWQINPPAFYGEHLVYELGDYDVALRLQGNPDAIIAAPGPGERQGEWQHYHHPAARNFAWSVSPFYQVLTQSVDLPGGGQTVAASYHFAPHAQAAADLLQAVSQSLVLYSKHFGPYPRPWLSAVQADIIDGMEYDGLFFLSSDYFNWHRSGPEDFLVALGAHETAHQWFGGLIGSDQARQPWLDEALCTYSEVLYYEAYAPDAELWWWSYRVNYYLPKGWVDLTIYDTSQWAGQYVTYRDPVYLRGAQWLRSLREAMGDEAFFAGLSDYTQSYTYRLAGGADFFARMQAHTSLDLAALSADFFQFPLLSAPYPIPSEAP